MVQAVGIEPSLVAAVVAAEGQATIEAAAGVGVEEQMRVAGDGVVLAGRGTAAAEEQVTSEAVGVVWVGEEAGAGNTKGLIEQVAEWMELRAAGQMAE